MPATRASTTAEEILDVAQKLVQTRGYNAFSYADISEALGIRKASIHYHFPSKDDLGKRLMARYRDKFLAVLESIDRDAADGRDKLRRYARVYLGVLRDQDKMCLCGMLAADFTTLARPVREEVKRFFEDNEKWLARVLAEGRKRKHLKFEGSPESQAGVLVSGLEGAMLLARSYADVSRFESTAQRLLAALGVTS